MAISATADKNKISILLVDDRTENLLALKAMLRDPGYDLVTARSGPEALKLLLKQEFALILLDVFMPEMDGYEVAKFIKERDKTKHIPIIFLTAMAKDVRHIFKAYHLGAVDYILKPLESHVVRAKVAVFADLYRKTQQIKYQAELIRQSELLERAHELAHLKQAADKRYQDLVEGIHHGFVWSADPETLRFTFVSPRAELILGYPISQWVSEEGFWVHHVYLDDRDRVLQLFHSAQTGRESAVEHRFLTSDGTVVWLHTGVRLARKGEGAGYELRGLSVNVTHLKEMEHTLQAALKTRDEFLSIASHELKTPITPIKLQTQMIMRRLEKEIVSEPSKEKILKTLEVLNRQLDRLAKLVDDLLDVSRISAGRFNITPEQVNLSELITDIIEHYHIDLERAGCSINLELSEGVIGTWDRSRLEQVIVNLLSNAIRYAPGGPIQIQLTSNVNTARVSVQDSGPGIPKQTQTMIFGRFERGTTSTHTGGLGLGLYITKRIIEAHGGTIRVESETGKGANFIIELPRKLAPETATTTASHSAA